MTKATGPNTEACICAPWEPRNCPLHGPNAMFAAEKKQAAKKAGKPAPAIAGPPENLPRKKKGVRSRPSLDS